MKKMPTNYGKPCWLHITYLAKPISANNTSVHPNNPHTHPCKKVTEMAKAMPQNGFLSLSWIKIKDIEKNAE